MPMPPMTKNTYGQPKRVNDPADERREQGGREVLRRVEDRRGGAALSGREPGRDNAGVAGKDGASARPTRKRSANSSDDRRRRLREDR